MKDSGIKTGDNDLRLKAEALLQSKSIKTDRPFSETEMLNLIYELEVHQIELKIQNEALIEAIEQAEIAKKQAEIATRKFSELYDSAPLGFFTLDKNGEIRSVNLHGSQMLGKQLSQLKNSLFGFHIAESSIPTFNQFLERIFIRKTEEICEITFYINDRLPFYFLLTGILIEKNELCLVTMIDITVIKESEEELRANKIRMDLAMRGGKMAWWEMDITTGNVTFSIQKAEMLGYPPEKFKHYKDFTDLVHPEDYPKIMQAMKGHIDGLYDKYESEYRIRTRSGEYVWFYDHGSIIKKDQKGSPLICTGFVYNITEQKLREEKLQKSEQMLQSVLDHFPGVVFWKDRRSVYLGCNQNFATGAGLNNSFEIVGKTDFELPWEKAEAENYLTDDFEVMENGIQKLNIIETQHQSDGRIVWFETSKLTFLDSNGEVIGLIGISNDISKLKTAEKELIQANKELIFENKEKGKRAEELIIANEELLFQNIEKGKRAEELVIANEELLFQIEEKEKRAEELITARYKAEESNRLKTAFLNNISHEIRTPFNGILGFIKLILEEETTSNEKDMFGQLINQSATRLINTIDHIIEISQIQSGKLEVFVTEFNIKLLMSELFNNFKSDCIIKSLEIKVTHDLTNCRENIFTDRFKLNIILSNLLENAIKYTKVGSVDFGYTFKPENNTSKDDETVIMNEIEFYVTDSGIGIPKSNQDRIFERFMQADISTTREFEGTGLGLAITKAYVEGLGGKLWVDSREGIGSTFYFTVPILGETAE